MPYTHFGKQADVWKHLQLCDILHHEQPNVYIETNSAYANYKLDQTPEQIYGVYSFIEKAKLYKELCNSKYYEQEYPNVKKNNYLGSPGLAMSILKNSAEKYIFYDIETDPLHNIVEFAKEKDLINRIEVVNNDSVVGVTDLLNTLPKSTFIHIDPYYIDKPGANGLHYLDLFIKASELGIKCYLWYGFNTLDDKAHLNNFIKNTLAKSNVANVRCTELILEIIQKDTISCNPGILGSGILTSNLSDNSLSFITSYSDVLVKLYRGTKFDLCKGDIYKETII